MVALTANSVSQASGQYWGLAKETYVLEVIPNDALKTSEDDEQFVTHARLCLLLASLVAAVQHLMATLNTDAEHQ